WTVLMIALYALLRLTSRFWEKQKVGVGQRDVLFAVALLAALAAGFGVNWFGAVRAVNLSIFVLTIVVVALCVPAAWSKLTALDQLVPLALLATGASTMLGRILLNGRISSYGFF